MRKRKKAILLVVIWGITLMLTILAIGSVYIMGNQAVVTEHRIDRTIAYYTAKSAIVRTLEDLRKGNPVSSPFNLNGLNVTVNITNITTPGVFNGTRQINVTVEYWKY